MEGNFVIFLYIFLFFFGANTGSFLNVLIDRLPCGEQVLKGRSYCDHCKHQLSWRDLFPIFSWISLGGRCRYCRASISVQYPLVEAATGVLFVLTFREIGVIGGIGEIWGLAYHLFIISALVVVFVADLKYQIIPDQVVYPAILISLPYAIRYVPYAIPSSLAAGLFFFLLWLATRGRGMGMGDVKLAFLMGLILGFPKIVVALYLAFLTGAFFGVILILAGKKRFGQHIPFGPFLAGGTYLSLFWGQNLWQFFQKILGIS